MDTQVEGDPCEETTHLGPESVHMSGGWWLWSRHLATHGIPVPASVCGRGKCMSARRARCKAKALKAGSGLRASAEGRRQGAVGSRLARDHQRLSAPRPPQSMPRDTAPVSGKRGEFHKMENRVTGRGPSHKPGRGHNEPCVHQDPCFSPHWASEAANEHFPPDQPKGEA